MARTAGIDWASEAHEVCVVEGGEVIHRSEVAHDERGLTALCRELKALGVRQVAIERPDGVLVERLVEAGLEMLAIHPNQLKAARPRYAVAHGKSDRFDAFVLAELARTDAHRFRVLRPDSDQTKALRTLTRSREELIGARVEIANQLRCHLESFWPGAAGVFASLESPIALAFLERYPSPTDARGLGEKRMDAFLARHGYSGGKSAPELLGRLRSAPVGTAGEAELAAKRAVVLGLVSALSPIVAQVNELGRQVRDALGAHPDAAIFAPLFRDSNTVICPATLIAELGDVRERYPTDGALAADAGQCPVAVESGKRQVASFRRACDKRLRGAIAILANSTRHWHPWAREVYRRARDRGQSHPHALRTLGRAWVRVLWRCWVDRVPYDPTLHGNLRRLEIAEG
jgi:transposase